MTFIDVLIDFVEYNRSSCFVRVELGVGPRSTELVFVFVGCFSVLVVKSTANADL